MENKKRTAASSTHVTKNVDGWWAKQRGATEAMTDGYGELIKKRAGGSLSGAAIGGLSGVGLAIASRGRINKTVGGVAGGLTGHGIGMYKADKAFLKKRGISMSRGGFKLKYTKEARKKYLMSSLEGILDAQLNEFRYNYDDDEKGMSKGKMIAGGIGIGGLALGGYKGNQAIKNAGGYKAASVTGARKTIASLPMSSQRKLMGMKWLKKLLTRGR